MLPHFVSRYLVPELDPTSTPAGFTRIDMPLVHGVPQAIPLTGDRRLLLVAPTGLANYWRDADPLAVIGSARGDYGPYTPQNRDDLERIPFRLLLQLNTHTIGDAMLNAGSTQRFGESGEDPVLFEVVVLDWLMYAGTLRGPGDFGSHISIAWQVANQAIQQFSEPPRNPVFVARRPDQNQKSGLKIIHAVQTRYFISKMAIVSPNVSYINPNLWVER